MIRIVVVDDHTLVRAGLCRLIEAEADLEVVAQAGNGRDALQLCEQQVPDVLLLDYALPDLDGLEVTQRLSAAGSAVRVLVLTMHGSEDYALRLLHAGASGFLLKGADTDELLAAIRLVAGGGRYVTPAIQERMLGRLGTPVDQAPEAILSNREMQVVVKLAGGASSREVAGELGLSLSTVESHRGRALEKLGLRNNADLTRFAIRRGLIDPG